MADSQEILLQKIKEQGDLVRKLKAAKESSEKGNNKGVYNLKILDEHLHQYSYVSGYTPGKIDKHIAQELENADFEQFINIKRWWYHMRSFSDSEVSMFPDTPPTMKFSNFFDEQVCEDTKKYQYSAFCCIVKCNETSHPCMTATRHLLETKNSSIRSISIEIKLMVQVS